MIKFIIFVLGFIIGRLSKRPKSQKGEYENNIFEVLDEIEETSEEHEEKEKPFVIEDKKEDMYSPKKQHEIEVVE